jgi:hypothetical protein
MREHPLHDAIEHPVDEPTMTALPAPAHTSEHAEVEPAETTAVAAETGTDLPPPLSESNPAPPPVQRVSADDNGPELPLGLPPKS